MIWKYRYCCSTLLLLFATQALATETTLTIYPAKIELAGARDLQSIVVQQVLPSGLTQDVTSKAKITLGSDQEFAKLIDGVVYPVSNGQTTLTASYEGLEERVDVVVENASSDPELSLRQDVMPVLMKAGCNTGRCHGAARGQDGFHLSLFGYDPSGDHHSLTNEIGGRRINLSRPEASLLLTKALAEAPHTGGQRITPDSHSHKIISRWIAEGASDDSPEVAVPKRLELYPPEAVIQGEGEAQHLTVLAIYSDGTTRDVTRWAVFLSNNDNSAAVDENGVITSGKPGEAFVMARFETFTEGVPVVVLPKQIRATPEMPEAWNAIDKAVHTKLRKLRVSPSDICSDEEFLRRVTLDLTGLTPTLKQREDFLTNNSPEKRAELIDSLLESESFVDVWSMRLGELLHIRTSNQISYKALLGFHNWVRKQVAENRPLDQLLADVLASSGGTFDTPPTNYFQIEANTLQLSENVAQTYLGMRIQCAQCHNHPFDRWTMDDYYGFTAFFAQVGFKQSQDPREMIIYDSGQGEVRHFVDGRSVEPKYLGGEQPEIEGQSRRKVLAKWIVSDANPAFARNIANIIWSQHFGRGIVEPVDDVRISNPPSNDQLLQLLADRLVESNYDLREMVRLICNSRTYQLSTIPTESNREDIANFAKASIRRLRAETLLDSISLVTESDDSFARLPAGARAVQIADGAMSNYFLTTFGRAPRDTVCACEVDVQPNLSQTLHLINGEASNNKVFQGGVINKLLDEGLSSSEIIDNLYLRCYSRMPTDAEKQRLLSDIDPDNPTERLEDVFWSLLNSKEFVFNH